MTKRVSYPVAIKKKAVEMKLEGVPTKIIMEQLGIKNRTQVDTWVRWRGNLSVSATCGQTIYL